MTVGAHGLWHRHFNRLSKHEARHELVESRRLLAEITGKPVDLLAWPFGECNEELEQLSAECGYRASWSVWKGNNSLHSLRRVPLGRRDNLARFVIKSSGFYALTKARWHRFNQKAENGPLESGQGRAVSRRQPNSPFTMKILFYNHTGQVSGAERMLLMILSRMDRKTFEPCLVCPPEGTLKKLASELGVKVEPLKSLEATIHMASWIICCFTAFRF